MKLMNKVANVKIILSFLVGLFIVYYLFMEDINKQNERDRLLSIFFDKNKIIVNSTKEIDKRKIKIWLDGKEKKLVYEYRKLDSRWTSSKFESVNNFFKIFFEEDKYYAFEQRYGRHTLLITYDERPLGKLTQFKTNWWHYHHYLFSVAEKDARAYVEIDVIGPDTATLVYNSFEQYYEYKALKRCKDGEELFEKKHKEEQWQNLVGMVYINKYKDVGINVLRGSSECTYEDYFTSDIDGNPFKNLIDAETIKSLGNNFYKDKNFIFHYFSMADGGSFYPFTKADYETFQVISDCYAKDKFFVYTTDQGRVLKNADANSFKDIEGSVGCFGKDKNR
ncbi:MAG: Unknown protein [uncultured Sulfurovum sp.]|uniref:Uncharacterized protein n=1 Tax=uncultured Sulfurovum sp. TaxID=269237 RepID=A0A6S6TSW6_9BACT|nr:MAG: Unknown protein [uncultured Sulfurovum sp.]